MIRPNSFRFCSLTLSVRACSALSTPNSFRIRSYANPAPKPFRIRSYKFTGGYAPSIEDQNEITPSPQHFHF
jgi:hypothetical protein